MRTHGLNQTQGFQFSFWFCLVLLSAVLTLSCTRKKTSGAKISLQFQSSSYQKIQAMSVPVGYVPGHMIVNVHYDGQVEVYQWDCKELENGGDATTCVFPSVVDFGNKEFPRGEGRIIQVLLVYGSQNGNLIFVYDDAMGVSFQNSVVDVEVGNNWEQQGGGKQGRVAGRLGTTLTGRVTGSFQTLRPNRPALKVFDEGIFSGWFNFMFFQGVKLNYEVLTATGSKLPIFMQKSLDDFEIGLSSTHAVAAFNLPSFYRVHQKSTGVYQSELSEAETHVIGFFDDQGLPLNNSVTASVQPPTGPETYAKLIRYLNAGVLDDPLYGTSDWKQPGLPATAGTETNWDTYRVQFITGLNPANTNSITQSYGMGTSNATACASAGDSDLVTTSCIHINPEYSKEHSFVPFQGPFELQNGMYGPEEISTSGSVITWKYLPGVANQSVHGVAVFLLNQLDEDKIHEEAPCHMWALQKGLPGVLPKPIDPQIPFVDFVSEVAATTDTGTFDLSVADTTNKLVVLCPWLQEPGGRVFYPKIARNHGFSGATATQQLFGSGNDGDVSLTGVINVSTDVVPSSAKKFSTARYINNITGDGLSVTAVNAFTANDFAVNDEILWYVAAAWATSVPDNACGGNLSSGSFGFAKITGIAANTLTLDHPVGDSSVAYNNTNISRAVVDRTQDFCRIFVQRVANFNNLTLTAATTLTANPLDLTNPDNGTGFVAFRVKTQLDLTGFVLTVNTDGLGYLGTISGQGDGIRGTSGGALGAANYSGGGHFPVDEGGGGGGNGGVGGNGHNGTTAGGVGGSANLFCPGPLVCEAIQRPFYGGGGGGRGSTYAGGKGGGIVILHIHTVIGSSNLNLTANGLVGDSYAGGGAGGTIHLTAHTLGNSVDLNANGANGNNLNGGGGGGGITQFVHCNFTGSQTVFQNGGSSSNGSAGAPGADFSGYVPGLCNP